MLKIHQAPFVIFAQARSGSTMLRRALHAHERICCHGELFMKKKVQGHSFYIPGYHWTEKPTALIGKREGDFTDFIRSYVFPPRGDWSAVGFKILDEQFYFDENRERLTKLIRDIPEMKLIFLRRENALERYVSRLIRRGQLDPARRAVVPVGPFVKFHTASCQRMVTLAHLFPSHQKISLTYESLAENIDTHLLFLYGFLGADFGPVTVEESKSTPRDLRAMIENYDELLEAAAKSEIDFDTDHDMGRLLKDVHLASAETWAAQAYGLGCQYANR